MQLQTIDTDHTMIKTNKQIFLSILMETVFMDLQ